MFEDSGVFAKEMDGLFQQTWLCVSRSDEFTSLGDFRTCEVGGSGVIVLRDEDGGLRALHNVCRNRGTRLLAAASGNGLRVVQCPYHAWTYDLDAELTGEPLMDGIEDFDRASSGLSPVHLDTWRGFVFPNLGRKAEPLVDYLGGLADRVRPYPLDRLRLAHRRFYDFAANWKLVLQNANECYHCPGVHPQLTRLTPFRSGEEDLRKGPVFGGWMDFEEGVTTLTASGSSSRRPFPGPSSEDLRRVYCYGLYPINFLSLPPDYVTMDWFLPTGPARTRLMFDLNVDQDEADPALDAMEFWDGTNRQDRHICELAQLGFRTLAYRQGRYSSEEEVVHLIDQHYVRRMGFLPIARARNRRG